MKNSSLHYLFLFAILLYIQAPVIGQIQWSAGLDIDFQKDATVIGSKTALDLYYNYNDFTFEKTTYEDTREIEFYNKYHQAGKGFKINGSAHIPINNKINFVTGLGIDFSSFYVNTVYTAINKTSKLLKTETVDSIPRYSHQNINYPHYGLNNIWNQNNTITLVNLYIPVEIDFEIFKNLRAFGGAKFKTPIYTRYDSHQKEISITDSGYQSTTKLIKDNSGDATKSISLEGFGGIKYRILDRYELSFSASKYFSSILKTPTKNKQKNITQDNDFRPYQPINYSIGVNYFFGE